MIYDVLILGAGPAGIMTALTLLKQKPASSVLLIDNSSRIGGKIPASGNGRCNFSNQSISLSDYLTASSQDVLAQVLNDQPVEKTLEFFQALGLFWREEEGRLYPASFEAKTFLNLLEQRLIEAGAELVCEFPHDRVRFNDSLWRYGPYRGKHLVLATGSPAGKPQKSYLLPQLPELDWLPWSPALVPIECVDFFKRLSGTRIPALLTAYGQDHCSHSQGTVLFSNYGLSGIATLDLASTLVDLPEIRGSLNMEESNRLQTLASAIYGPVSKKCPYLISLNFFPEWSETDWHRQASLRIRGLEVDLAGLLPSKVQSLVEELWSRLMKKGEDPEQIFRGLLGSFPFLFHSLRSFEHAQVARGGLRLDDWCAKTLEHKSHPRLYAVGEILDVVGRCGGFNLQWAWSSAQQVGEAISRSPLLERLAP